jgi:hypothetical protein
MEPSTAHIEEIRHTETALLAESIGDVRQLVFEKDDAQHLAAVTLYATILQGCHECLVLLREPSVTAVGGMLRSILESYADLRATIKDPQYVKRLVATFYREKLRLLGSMRRDPNNEFHADLAQHIDAEREAPKVRAELVAINAQPLENYERFAAGDQQELTGFFTGNCAYRGTTTSQR